MNTLKSICKLKLSKSLTSISLEFIHTCECFYYMYIQNNVKTFILYMKRLKSSFISFKYINLQ